MNSFKELYDAGIATQDMLDDLVDEWHDDANNDLSLMEFLGFADLREYNELVTGKKLK